MMNRRSSSSSIGSFAPWETFLISEHASNLGKAGEISFLPCHVQQQASWIAGKQSAGALPGTWAFCQKDEVMDRGRVGNGQSVLLENQKMIHQMSTVVDKTDFEAVKRESLRVHRSRLEFDVSRLEKRLQEERDLHCAYTTAHENAMEAISSLPSHLPVSAQKLLLDVATLEFSVSKLEEQMLTLQSQVFKERSAYEKSQSTLQGLSQTVTEEEPGTQASCLSPSSQGSSYLKPVARGRPPSPATPCAVEAFSDQSSGASTEANGDHQAGEKHHSSEDVLTLEDYRKSSADEESEWRLRNEEEQAVTTSGKWESRDVSGNLNDCGTEAPPVEDIVAESLVSEALWRYPNSLSEQMVQCMVDIYHHLSGRSTPHSKSIPRDMPSPTSPFVHLVSSSLSSVSESSFVSFARSPLVDWRNKAGVAGQDSVFDPYTMEGKVMLPEIGAYQTAAEVSWISVGKRQLNYAAGALQRFKLLVEHLSRVDPSSMRHVEKLAFWINVHNALMMHAFLAYGTPDNEAKYFSLMQKASYVIGGHSFNAITIEYAFLKSRASTYRPQLELLLALKEINLSEQQTKFGISHAEPLTLFALSFGAWSCPAVRIYTAETIYEQLEVSLRDYLRASVGINHKSSKLMVPKLLYAHVRETQGSEVSLADWICAHLSSSQLRFVMSSLKRRKQRGHSAVQVLPFDFRFRYLFLAEI
ncbi:uncharacterized protein LOC9648917 isoform X1 [Selaginella moellendorffii]|uniref:uncharacterized protein LOC9648917 isoform X1 n=1 Tax=Selaginella moellendorffii TaxID=88036 RepID=UPI000D1C9A02|nr:uncharacterized protein LOC9648917 isoform X1 [Selaginella moellendorffii]|eukprot:XP_024545892.1 uncharacterized protein LOC9648917 isoform X1 [Selaginella moellendorffii]